MFKLIDLKYEKKKCQFVNKDIYFKYDYILVIQDNYKYHQVLANIRIHKQKVYMQCFFNFFCYIVSNFRNLSQKYIVAQLLKHL